MPLEVDGSVVDADDLLGRVRALMRSIEERHTRPSPPPLVSEPTMSALETALAEMEPIVTSLHVLQAQLVPPQLTPTRGIRARIAVLLKRVIRRLTRWYVEPRWILQVQHDALAATLGAALLAGVRQVNTDLSEVRLSDIRQLHAEIQDLREQISRLRLQVVGSVERFNRHRRDIDTLVRGITEEDSLPQSRKKRAGAHGPGQAISYVAFENRCRGASEELRNAQERYLSFFPGPLEGRRIVDIGCGRGEMLELLISAGHDVIGVDTDPGMVDLCRAKGLPVIHDDALHFLDQSSPESYAGIFCAQVVEHLTTPELEELLSLSRKTLIPTGVLVIETINPRSSFAIGNHFFADLTHIQPVHPETLRFLCEELGFHRVQLEERSPHPAMGLVDHLPADEVGGALRALLASVFGYQDYAIVATK